MPLDAAVIYDLTWLRDQCAARRLTDATKWASEMLCYLPEPISTADGSQNQNEASCSYVAVPERVSKFTRLAQSCMDCQEFDRAEYILAKERDDGNKFTLFLTLYCKYLAGEKKRLDCMADVGDSSRQTFENDSLAELQRELEAMDERGALDGFLYYLYGLVLLGEKLKLEARGAFTTAVNMLPALWPAWRELGKLVESKYELKDLTVPEHWLKQIFLGDVYNRLQMFMTAADHFEMLMSPEGGFENVPYLMGQMAAARHGLKDHNGAVDDFAALHELDPFRIEFMDTYSNSLFVLGQRVELATLAHHFFNVNKFTPETCCIVGNYYALRKEHERAALYFQRALKLNPNYVDAWTLMGHEFMEMRNTAAACRAYRHALELDKRDLRAWYGLGHMYEILRMTSHAIYYFQQAHKCRPEDSRILMALGEMYQKLGKTEDAQKCYWKAHTVGDIEGGALVRLGKLFEKEKQSEQAASCFMKYLKQLERHGFDDDENQPYVYRFLADYCLGIKKLDEAHYYAQQCLKSDTVENDGL